MRFTFIAAAALALVAAAHADVLPPQEEISDVQQALVGTWQQTALTGAGHGEAMQTLFFGKSDFKLVSMNALPAQHVYSVGEEAGTWTGTRVSPSVVEVTLTLGLASPGVTPPTETLHVEFTAPDTITIAQQIGGGGEALVTYKHVYP